MRANDENIIIHGRREGYPILAEVLLSERPDAFARSDSRLFVSAEHRVHVFDISDLDAPIEIGFFDTPGGDLEVSGKYVYVAGGEYGLMVYRISEEVP